MSENKIALRKEQVELIEELANTHESMGLPPAMAKIMALLTVGDEVELTFEQIKDTLNLSKSAVSQAITQLLGAKRIAYKTKIGDRKRYFHIRMSDWETSVMEQFTGIKALVKVHKKILVNRPAKTKEFNLNLKEMTDYLAFLQSQTPLLFKKSKT